MPSSADKSERLLTIGIIAASVLGVGYFIFTSFFPGTDEEQQNPFEYNIEHFKQSDSALNKYNEIAGIKADFQKMYALAIGSLDRLYLAGDQAYHIYDNSGVLQSTVACGQPARALAVDINNDVYLGMTDHIRIFDQSGKQKSRWTQFPGKSMITSLAVTEKEVYVADAGNFVVWKYDKSGHLQQRIGEKDPDKGIPGFIIPSPYFDLAVDPDGFLWVVNPGRLTLENYTMDGGLRTSWGEAGMDIERFCGCCNPGHIAILQDGSFVTAEKGIARVKIYNRLGRLVAVVAGPEQFTEGTVGMDLAVDSRNRIYVLDPKRHCVRIFEKKS